MVKLFWEFRGPDSNKTAHHFLIHLNEFLEREKLNGKETGVEIHTNMFHSAFLIIEENHLNVIKNALKPNRGIRL